MSLTVGEFFKVPEFVPKGLHQHAVTQWGDGDLSIRFINPILIEIATYVRKKYQKPVQLNTYMDGGEFDGRVLRLPGDSAYMLTSDHNYNLAIDFVVVGVDSLQVQKDMLTTCGDDLIELGVSGIEDGTIGWTHLGISDLSQWTNIPVSNDIKLIPIPKK
jgi:hypothetical protein